ncbi:hypothetical protein TNCV_1070561 [Trichonephila clavipes]|nr:hypothetical protein TNCV_1070561 [Trichonephila clavipes]
MSLVYADKPQTLDHLEDNIRRVIADIRPQMLEKVIENWTSRLDYIRASRGVISVKHALTNRHGKEKHEATRAFFDCLTNLRRQVACIKAKPTSSQVSQKKQWRGLGRVLFEVHGSLRELPPVNFECRKLASNWAIILKKHDPNEERDEKFQRDLKSLMSSYGELYNNLSKSQTQQLTTEFVLIPTEIPGTRQANPNFVQEIQKKISSMGYEDNNIFLV